MIDSSVETARKAFYLFAHGWKTGDFEPYIAMLADEMIFWFPIGTHRGKFIGVAGRQEMIAKCRDHTAAGDRLTLHEPHHIMTNGSSTMFEFDADGLYGGEPYQGHNAIAPALTYQFAFQIQDDKIIGFREYFGDLGA